MPSASFFDKIELVIDDLPGVVESAVIGVPHKDFGRYQATNPSDKIMKYCHKSTTCPIVF